MDCIWIGTMEITTLNGRPWTWTPSPTMNRFMSICLRLPVLHRLASKMILLITFTGRKTDQHYTTPVGYHREGTRITILTKRFRKWWHNFEESAPVEMCIEGRDRSGQATALSDLETIIPIIAHVIDGHRREAESYGIKLFDDGKPDMDSIRAVAPKLVVIQVTLNSKKAMT